MSPAPKNPTPDGIAAATRLESQAIGPSSKASNEVIVKMQAPNATKAMVRMPAGVGGLIKDAGPHNWGFYTEPQKHMNKRQLWWPRGKGWGGSSSINGMIYIRGHARDYDQWRQSGLTGWGYADVLPVFRRQERNTRLGDDPYHGASGPLVVDDPSEKHPVTQRIIDAAVDCGVPLSTDLTPVRSKPL